MAREERANRSEGAMRDGAGEGRGAPAEERSPWEAPGQRG